jgi:hypothetical protein
MFDSVEFEQINILNYYNTRLRQTYFNGLYFFGSQAT